MLGVWAVVWTQHLSSGKFALVLATVLALVFGLDDLIGPARTNAWAASWLSAAARFFSVLIRHVLHSAVMLQIVGMISVATIFAALSLFAGYWLWIGLLSASADPLSTIKTVSALFFVLLAFGAVLAIGHGLESYFERDEVKSFLRDHGEYLEIRIMAKVAAGIQWAVEEAERDSFRRTPTGLPSTPQEIRMPVHGILMVVWVPVTLTLILSLVFRTAWLVLSGMTWLVVFAPAQALNAMGKRTGAENLIKVGKYVALLIISIYGLVHD